MQGMDYVYAVWQEKSFSAAARKLFVSQPALSASVRKVERELGLPIFNRSTTPLQLTDAGRALAQSIEAQLVQLRRAALADVSVADQEAALRVIKAFEAAGQLPDGAAS